jgi:hypothetical protein
MPVLSSTPHEAWEERWLVETNDARRRLLQGLIQIAVAFHKLIVMGAADSASRLLAKGLAKLDAPPAKIAGMSVCAFRDAVQPESRLLQCSPKSLRKSAVICSRGIR